MDSARDGGGGTGGARRRRERRQRSWWRREQLNVRFALSTAQHHSGQSAVARSFTGTDDGQGGDSARSLD